MSHDFGPKSDKPTRRVAVASLGGLGAAALTACNTVVNVPPAPAPPVAPPAPQPIRRAGIEAAPPPIQPLSAVNPGNGTAANGALQRIAVVSCIDQTLPMGLLDAVTDDKPGLVLFGGDNVYASKPPFSLSALDAAYRTLAANPSFARLRQSVPHLAIWDDHDFGINDGGADFAAKVESKNYFLRFWNIPQSDPRTNRDGIYAAQTFGPPGQRVQVIMVDVRYNKSPWRITDQRDAPGKERYVPDASPNKTMLGEPQWQWLEAQLRQPADVRVILSGLQTLALGHGWESWAMFPTERQRMFDTIARAEAQGVVFLSGDRHIGGIYRESVNVPYTFTELTSSGVTHVWETANEPGPNRLGDLVRERHFGTVEIDWSQRVLALKLKNAKGSTVREQAIAIDSLRPTNPKRHIK